MLNLPFKLPAFFLWLLVKIPARIFIVSQRAVALLNHELALSLNITLLFTPIFGDYTKAGRIISFFFRLGEVIIGTVLILTLWIISFITPLVWYAIPFALFYYIDYRVLTLIPILFVAYVVKTREVPAKRISNTVRERPIKALRPSALRLYNQTDRQRNNYLDPLLKNPQILYLLVKAELLNEEVCKKDGSSTFCKISGSFTQKILEAPSIDKSDLLAKAYDYAKKDGTRFIEIEHIFLAFLSGIPKVDTILSVFNSNLTTIEEISSWIVTEREELCKLHFWQEDYKLPVMGGIGKGMTGRVTPALDSVSEDLTKKAQKGLIRSIVGRETEVKKVAEMLSGTNKNVLLIGEPGSGKTSIVRGIAHKVVGGIEYPALKFKRIVSIESGSLIAGTKTTGDIAQKVKNIMDEVDKSGDIILFVDEIHTLVAGASGESGGEVSNIFSILEPHIRSNIQFIGATNMENYRKYIEPNGSFARLFEIVEIPPASKEDTLQILKSKCKSFEKDYSITITYPALKKVIELSDKLIHERVFPDKALDILNRTASSKAHTNKYLISEDIASEISAVTHVPVTAMTENESQKLLNIENAMRKRVIGQEEAITQVGSALKRARVGIRNESKPIASFLFVGTTGVGKTETAKALAREYFGDEKAMIRLDMSEYQQVDSIDRLIGTPDGKNKGILTEAVRTKPFALILLDEIEKAYSNILMTFLQVLDDGRLTDSTGRVIDFTNTIIIATSNVGTRGIQDIARRNGTFEEMSESANKDVREKFAPEFLNRFNGVIVFRPLNTESMAKITLLLLEKVAKMAEGKGIKLEFKQELLDELIKRGYNPEWGARPMTRVIENSVENYIAVKILSNELKQGDTAQLGVEVFSS